MTTNPTLYLLEMEVRNIAANSTQMLYFCSNGYFRTEPNDNPSNQSYKSQIKSLGTFEQTLLSGGKISGRSTPGLGVIELNNSDGSLDYLNSFGFDGRAISIRKGRKRDSYQSFDVVFQGIIAYAEFDWDVVKLVIQDKQGLLTEETVQKSTYLGDNVLPDGTEGADDIKGNFKPLLFGTAYNIPPVLVNTSKLVYQISDLEINDVLTVYDRGVALNKGNVRNDLASLLTQTPSPSSFDFYLGDGIDKGAYLRLGTNPSGQITCDAQQGSTSSDRTCAALVKQILESSDNVTLSDLDTSSFTDLDSYNNSEVGIWVDSNSVSIASLLDSLVNSISSFWSFNFTSNKFYVSYVDSSLNSSDSVATFSQNVNIIDSRNSIEILSDKENSVPNKSIVVAYRYNNTIQTENDLAGAALTRVNFTNQEYRKTSELAVSGIDINHPLSETLEWFSFLVNESDADNLRLFLSQTYGVKRLFIKIRTPIEFAEHLKLGDTVTIKIARYSWDNGQLCSVIGLVIDRQDNTAEVTLRT